MTDHAVWHSPLEGRYASQEMLELFSDDTKYRKWRRVWATITSVRCVMDAGISQAQADELFAHIDDPIDYEHVSELEKKLKHDVAAHMQHFAESCPLTGTMMMDRLTSSEITDNAELIVYREALRLLQVKVARCIFFWSKVADTEMQTAVTGYTHLVRAASVTVGKRISRWIWDLLDVYEDIDRLIKKLKLRGIKGASGTQASFLDLFEGDFGKVLRFEELFAKALDFDSCYDITGQTYSRLVDVDIMAVLSKFGTVVHNICFNIRMWHMQGELQEPFGEGQKGSNAMPWKRNPKDSERGDALARPLISCDVPIKETHAVQLFERTLDDSAIRRLTIPEAFLLADSVARILQYLGQSPVIHHDTIKANLAQYASLMVSERLLSHMVKAGQDREETYRRLQAHSSTAFDRMSKSESNNFEQLVREDSFFAAIAGQFDQLFDPKGDFGAADMQTKRFLVNRVAPVLALYTEEELNKLVDLKV